MITIWSGEPRPIDAAELKARLAGLKFASCVPFSPERLMLLEELSRRILKDPRTRQAPQYVALAYWLRRASMQRLVEALAANERVGQVRSARGVALHLPPTNVDTIFVYSWAMSVLAGNANVVRLPETLKLETSYLLELVMAALQAQGEADRHLFCQYPYGAELDADLATHFDLRLIWGGDEKVAAVSKIPIRPDGLSIGFPDRKSIAVISAQAYRDADQAQRDALSDRLFNDIFWFDQMGCGSPRLLIWLGDPANMAADFYQRVAARAMRKDYKVEPGTAIAKLALSHDLLAEAVTTRHETFGNPLHVSRAADPRAALKRPHGGGFLCDWVANSISDISDLADRSLQTVTHFGLQADQCLALAKGLRGRGGYRVVPIGEALQFEPTWDGVDLLQHMTRLVTWR